MRNLRFHLSIVFTFFLLFSCKKESQNIENIITRAEHLVDSAPDSAIFILDSITNPYELSEKEFADYILTYTQAKDKNYKDITGDTLVFKARDYYIKDGNRKKLAKADFYCARVTQSRKEYEKAIRLYLKAHEEAEKNDNYYLAGLSQFFIGEMNYNQQLFDEAITWFNRAASYFSQDISKYRNEIVCMNLIANCYFLKQKDKIALSFYNKALSLAKQNNDSIEIAGIIQNYGVYYRESQNNKEAKAYFYHALSYANDNVIKAKIYYNLGEVYHGDNKRDSSEICINLSLKLLDESKNYFMKANIYKLISTIEQDKKNFQKALEYHQLFSENMKLGLKGKDKSALLDVQKKYNLELLQNANNKLLIEKLAYFIGFLLSILCIIIISLVFNRKSKKNKEDLHKAQQDIVQFQEVADNLRLNTENLRQNMKSQNEEFKNILFKRFEIQKKAALLDGYLSEQDKKQGSKLMRKYKEIVYENGECLQWDEIYEMLNKLYNNFPDKLSEKFPFLDEQERRICYLSVAKLTNSEIAIILESTTGSIQVRKTAIRKKTGMSLNEEFMKSLLDTLSK